MNLVLKLIYQQNEQVKFNRFLWSFLSCKKNKFKFLKAIELKHKQKFELKQTLRFCLRNFLVANSSTLHDPIKT